MKKLFVSLSIIVSLFSVSAQTTAYWMQTYGASGIEVGYAVRSCLDQGYIAAGTSASLGPADGYVVRTDSLGLVMWSKNYGGINIDVIRALEILPDSGFIVAGYTNSAGAGGYDGWLLRLNKNGDTLWTKTIGTNDWDFFYDIHCCEDGGFLLAGGTYGLGAGEEDMYVVRTNASGDTLWTRTYGGTKADEARSVVETEDSLIAVCGINRSLGDTLGDSWIIRLNSNGDTLWTYRYGFPNSTEIANSICFDPVGNLLLFCGSSDSAGNSNAFWGGVFYDQIVFPATIFPGPLDEDYCSIKVQPGFNKVAMVGSNYSTGAGYGDMYIFGSDPAYYFTTYGTLSEDRAYDFDYTHDNAYILCGSTLGFGLHSENLFLVKTDSLHYSPTILGVAENTPAGNSYVAAYPSPAHNIVNFNITSSTDLNAQVILTITDITGRVIEKIYNSDFQKADSHHCNGQINTSEYSSGIYFYTLTSGLDLLFTDKFVVSHP